MTLGDGPSSRPLVSSSLVRDGVIIPVMSTLWQQQGNSIRWSPHDMSAILNRIPTPFYRITFTIQLTYDSIKKQPYILNVRIRLSRSHLLWRYRIYGHVLVLINSISERIWSRRFSRLFSLRDIRSYLIMLWYNSFQIMLHSQSYHG